MTEKQEALKEMPDGSDINDIGDWAFKHRNTIRAALTETPKADVVGLVGRQANDDGLWFMAKTAAEAYLQQELRKLHAAIEGQAFTEAPKVDVEELYKGSRRLSSLHTGRVALVESQHDEGWNDCLDHITTHYHLVKKEKKHD